MGLFSNLATVDDFLDYTKTTESPSGLSLLLDRGNELITMAMGKNYDETNEEHVELAKLAVCAQCLFWIENDLSPMSAGNIGSYSLGSMSVTNITGDDVQRLTGNVCKQSARYLNYKHLMYVGRR